MELVIGVFLVKDLTTLSRFNRWNDLDVILSQHPTLRRVTICVESFIPEITSTKLRLVMHRRLPCLNARGILFVRSGNPDREIGFPVDYEWY